MNCFDLTHVTEVEPDVAMEAACAAEIEAHEDLGWYVPTREELMDTTGDFFAHLMLERE